jgi:branched-chain amino acid aminotransferase
MDALAELLKLERDWIPSALGTSLYIRPTVFAVDECLSVHASKTYLFYIILSPVGSYYKNGLQPVRLLVEDAYCRACPGGTGATKYIGNYGASLKAGEAAERAGFDQVLWLDAAERKYVEEVGSMNIFFVLNGKVVTPALSGSVLNGITRRSVIELLNKSGRAAEERRVPIAEILSGAESGELSECFGTGTAAVVSPVGYLRSGKTDFSIGGGQIGPVSRFVYDTLTGIQTGATTDPFGWTTVI